MAILPCLRRIPAKPDRRPNEDNNQRDHQYHRKPRRSFTTSHLSAFFLFFIMIPGMETFPPYIFSGAVKPTSSTLTSSTFSTNCTSCTQLLCRCASGSFMMLWSA